MNRQSFFFHAAALGCALLVSACGGGGGGEAVAPNEPIATATSTGPNSFLLFPNALQLADGSLESNTQAYAQAYYAAIDPANAKDTLDKWKAANGFGGAAGTLGEVAATFGDMHDLGYGRRMRMRQNPDGTIAAFVENYQVNAGAGYTYTRLNLDAALAEDRRWHIGTNAIEYSPGPNGGTSFVKFYTFDPQTGARLLMANLDGRGSKAMPGICINCHGGRMDPLTPSGLFPLVANSASQHRGDVQARMQMFKVDDLDFSTTAGSGHTRGDLEAVLKTMNRIVLCSYPLAGAAAGPEDTCRPAASSAPNEWQGTAAAFIKAAYGGDGLPGAAYSGSYVPAGWPAAGGRDTLFRTVVKPACITCHSVRGTANQDDIDFMDYQNFEEYAPRIKYHVFDRGNMPLAKIVYENFWTANLGDNLGLWLESLGLDVRDGGAAVVRPGRPVADPGPARVVRAGSSTLSAANSLFANAYQWSIVSNPGNAATLTNAASATPTFTATADGTYGLQLVVSDGATQSAPATLTLVVNNSLPIAPSAIRFADIKPVLQGACVSCHRPSAPNPLPPIFYEDIDRNGDGLVNAVDDAWLYKEVRGRINFSNVAASPLLRKPSGKHHNGGLQAGFDAGLVPGAAGRDDYDLFLNWILNGAPQ